MLPRRRVSISARLKSYYMKFNIPVTSKFGFESLYEKIKRACVFYVDKENTATLLFGGNTLKVMKSVSCLIWVIVDSVSSELQHPFPPQFPQFIPDAYTETK